jgi:hypothetical protein
LARAGAALLVLLLAVGAAGCGEEDGVAEGATVTVYVEAPLCEGAKRGLAASGGEAEQVRVRVACLAAIRDDEGVDLAVVGANARRATEDSATIVYVGEPGAPARFSSPIVEAAGIASITGISGDRAMQRVLDAVAESDSSSLRDEVRKTLESQ